ncbi:MAG: 4-alpha-glucanotransferase [Clostridiales bacterium]|nr:4-alpha-glucanotransferase [Clostridiales bacterium]
MRAGGILLPVSSLPSPYGIGCFSKEAYEFIDFLVEAGQRYWQILPLGPTGYGDSPYQSFSTFAGNPYFIDLEALVEEGVLTREECEACDFGSDARKVDYGKLYKERLLLLRKAYERSQAGENAKFHEFQRREAYWLRDYAIFMAVKNRFDGAPWNEWAEDIRFRWDNALEYYQRELYFEIEFYEFLQYTFFLQWKKLKDYANGRGIQIIGDIPIYVAYDSSDAWAHPELFQFDEQWLPRSVAGCPPDGFSATGQLWGNPLYRWDYHRDTGFGWWVQRISKCFELYDMVRIDHFRGFDEYYSIPYGHKTAEFGHWEQGPGIDLFRALRWHLGDRPIIAEDLGYMTSTVKQLVKDSGYPGMKVLEFAFDSRDSSDARDYLPHNYTRNCVVYTGTHDNETLLGWLGSIEKEEKENVREYLDRPDDSNRELALQLIRLAVSSVADLCVIPMQDYLGLDNRARINQPSTTGKNWKWRMDQKMLTKEAAGEIYRLTALYGRI